MLSAVSADGTFPVSVSSSCSGASAGSVNAFFGSGDGDLVVDLVRRLRVGRAGLGSTAGVAAAVVSGCD